MDKLNMIARLVLICAAFFSTQALAAGGANVEHANIDPNNIASLQRGAANFMNYCSGCHSAKYVRYKTIGKDLELSDELLIENLMFNAEKTFETINAAMPAADAERWFGTAPPDLSLMARAKGADYIYSFLKGFFKKAGPALALAGRLHLWSAARIWLRRRPQRNRPARARHPAGPGPAPRRARGPGRVGAGERLCGRLATAASTPWTASSMVPPTENGSWTNSKTGSPSPWAAAAILTPAA